MLVHRQHTFTFDNCPVYIFREDNMCQLYCNESNWNINDFAMYVHCSKFFTLFIIKSVTIAASNAALTNTCIHIIPCACRTLSLTRTLCHLHAQSSHGQSCLCVCVRTSVGVCHFAISLCFVRADWSFIQWFSISLLKRLFYHAWNRFSVLGTQALLPSQHLLPVLNAVLNDVSSRAAAKASCKFRHMWFVFVFALLYGLFV